MKVTIPSYLCDIDDRLHPWAAVRMFQEVSEHHTNDLHIGFEDLLRNGRAWVLARAYYEFRRRPQAFEAVEIGTWSRGNNGLFAFRDYEMRSASGDIILCGTSYWPVIDMQTRSVLRLHDMLADFPPVYRDATSHSKLGRLPQFAVEGLKPDMEVDVRYSMIDHTRHVNNAEYNKWIFDHLASQGVAYDNPFSIELNYQTETRPGERCQLYCQPANAEAASPECAKTDQKAYLLQIFNSRGLGVTARFQQPL